MVNRNRSNYCALLNIVFFFLLAGEALARTPKLPSNFSPLPLIHQETDYSCGAAAYLSIAKYWNVFEGSESDLYSILETTEKNGTNPKNLVRAANQMKLRAHYSENVTIENLRESWKRGDTVILALQAWRESSKPWKDLWNDGHYIVMLGLDNDYLYAMDPSLKGNYGYLPLNELYERWHDFEIEDGKKWKHHQLAVFINGVIPAKPFPVSEVLERID